MNDATLLNITPGAVIDIKQVQSSPESLFSTWATCIVCLVCIANFVIFSFSAGESSWDKYAKFGYFSADAIWSGREHDFVAVGAENRQVLWFDSEESIICISQTF